MKYYALEGDEIIFEVEADSQQSAETRADLEVFGNMHQCHHQSWITYGRVMSDTSGIKRALNIKELDNG